MPDNLIYHYQTLIGAAFAILAAAATIHRIERQIRSAEKIAEDQRQRRLKGAWVHMPSALSRLSDDAEACAHAAVAIYKTTSEHKKSFFEPLGYPALPPDLPTKLQSVIEFGDGRVPDEILQILQQMQVQYARLGKWQSGQPTKVDRL